MKIYQKSCGEENFTIQFVNEAALLFIEREQLRGGGGGCSMCEGEGRRLKLLTEAVTDVA